LRAGDILLKSGGTLSCPRTQRRLPGATTTIAGTLRTGNAVTGRLVLVGRRGVAFGCPVTHLGVMTPWPVG